MFKRAYEVKESRGVIISDQENAIDVAIESIKRNRKALENYGKANQRFLFSLKPVPAPNEPLVAKLMAEASEKACVGPMAAVAGVLADLAVKDMLDAGCETAVVEDGGEISAVSNTPIDVAEEVGDDPLSKKFGFRLTDFPIGIATSSGCFSHALSFGDAEAATVFCKTAGLADAAATAVGNIVKGSEFKVAVKCGIDKALAIDGVEGVIILYKGFVGTGGKVPKLIRVK